MTQAVKNLAILILFVAAAFGANNGTISGTVKDPDGGAFSGAAVQAQNTKTRISVIAFSDRSGRYRIQNLGPGEYDVSVRAVGYKADSRSGLNISGGQSASADFALQNGTVHWNDLSIYQGKKLMPDGKGKEILTGQCFACHGFQTRIATTRRTQQGWVQAINYMRTVMHARLANHVNDQDAQTLADYLNNLWGEDAKMPASPADLPAYKETLRNPFTDESFKIAYVEYEMPAPNRYPFSAAPDKNGYLWLPYFGRTNKIGRLDPATGTIQEYPVPSKDTAGIHSAIPAPDGSVWIGEQASNRVGRWDPNTQTVTEFQDIYAKGLEGMEDGGSKHTVRVDSMGRVWGTAVRSNLTVFDPKTREFTRFKDVLSPYGVEIDKQGNPWFAEFRDGGAIGMVVAKTGEVKRWNPPTPNGWPRRIEFDSKGIVWFAEYRGGKIGRFDPKAETFKEFQLPGPSLTPSGPGVDKKYS